MADFEPALEKSVELIHASPTKAVVYVTGGASQACGWLLSVPGASSTVLEWRVPYDRSSFVDTVGSKAAASIESFGSANSARTLARAAYQRAVRLASPGARVCGVAAACALVSTTPKKGDHRAFVAAHSSERITEYELYLLKGHRSRWGEEALTSRLVLQALVDDCGVMPRQQSTGSVTDPQVAFAVSHQSSMSLVRDFLVDGDRLQGPCVQELTDPIGSLLSGGIQFAEYSHGIINRDATSATLILPGSFNPIHHGHRALMDIARKVYPNDQPAYEISVTNPDKPSLKPEVIRARLSQFAPSDTVVITSAPLFSTKAKLFPNAKFVIGVDTALRIVAPKYYGGEAGMIAALVDLRSRGCKFLVAGRLDQRKDTGVATRYLTLADVSIPTGLEDLFEAIPDSFRVDVSSSAIRESKGSP